MRTESTGVVEGQVRIGGQEHFYFEPNVTLANPVDTEMELISSTQNTKMTQKLAASVLDMPENKVSCSIRRLGKLTKSWWNICLPNTCLLGGGFGGKETGNILFACAAAVAAYHENKPVRLLLGRDEDMEWTGRH